MIAIFILLGQVAFTWVSDSLGRQEAVHTFHHAQDLIGNDIDHLAITVKDWSNWDDSYEYLQDYNRDFESANFQEQTFLTLRLSYFAMSDSAGRLHFIYPADRTTASVSLEALRTEALRSGSATDIVEVDGSFHYAAASAVLRTDGSGPPAGTIIMARTIDREALDKIMLILDSEISVERKPKTIGESGPLISRLKEGKYEAFGAIRFNDSSDGAALRVKLEKRSIALSTPFFLLAMLVVMAVLLSVTGVILLTLDRTVVRPIDCMGKELEKAASEGLKTFRVTVAGNDEISRLGVTLNRTFDALERSSAERESLFQEIRHRVKNNLQVVASLLSLQADESGNPETSTALQNSRRRVLAMAFVHEELYCSATLNSIDLHEYLERLTILVRHSLDPDGVVEFKFDVPELDLSIERAVPFALIANEVLSNSYQHAFDGRDPCGSPKNTVELSLREESDGFYSFSLRDNGCGIKKDSEKKGTLGLTLIQALALQLGAQYTYETMPDGGTEFRMKFDKA